MTVGLSQPAADPWRWRFVMLSGASPGIGKTTLAEGLARRRSQLAAPADLFTEDQIFEREDFAEIGRAFRDRTYPTAHMMIEGYRRVISHLGPGRGALVFDWSCLGMVSDLPWAEGKPDILQRHARQVAQLVSHLGPVLLDLTGDITTALQRAQSQRGEQWTRRYARLAAQHAAITARDRLGAITESIQADPARALEKRAFLAAGWPVIDIDAAPGPDEVLDAAWRTLASKDPSTAPGIAP